VRRRRRQRDRPGRRQNHDSDACRYVDDHLPPSTVFATSRSIDPTPQTRACRPRPRRTTSRPATCPKSSHRRTTRCGSAPRCLPRPCTTTTCTWTRRGSGWLHAWPPWSGTRVGRRKELTVTVTGTTRRASW
jgi:hypothetical protein